jgi:hypothetical protein
MSNILEVLRLRFISIQRAWKYKVGRKIASTRNNNNDFYLGCDQRTLILGTVDAFMLMTVQYSVAK